MALWRTFVSSYCTYDNIAPNAPNSNVFKSIYLKHNMHNNNYWQVDENNVWMQIAKHQTRSSSSLIGECFNQNISNVEPKGRYNGSECKYKHIRQEFRSTTFNLCNKILTFLYIFVISWNFMAVALTKLLGKRGNNIELCAQQRLWNPCNISICHY